MIILSTDEARVVHLLLGVSARLTGLLSDADAGHFATAIAKFRAHDNALVKSMISAGQLGGKEPA